MLERIKQLMEAKGLTSTQFADGIEVPRAIVSHILSGRNKPSLDVVLKILQVYRDVSMHWLLLGEGNMLKNLATEKAAAPGVKVAKEPASETVNEDVAPEKPIEKIQSVVQPETAKSSAKLPAKVIERIIIFYSDKTFDTYSPI